MFCIKCGSKNQDDANFRYKCGHCLVAPQQSVPEETTLVQVKSDTAYPDVPGEAIANMKSPVARLQMTKRGWEACRFHFSINAWTLFCLLISHFVQ